MNTNLEWTIHKKVRLKKGGTRTICRALVVTLVFLGAHPCAAGEKWFLLQKVDRDAPASALRNKGVDGVSIRVRWQLIEPQDDEWDWSYLDRQVQQARDHGKLITLRVMAGLSAPDHSYRTLTRGIPTPWGEHHMAEFGEMISKVAERYSQEDVWLIHVPGFWASAEMHLPKGFGHRTEMIGAWVSRIKAVKHAYPTKQLALNHSPEPFSEAVVAEFHRIVGKFGAIQMNSLKASTKTQWIGYRRIVEARQAGWTIGWQFVGPSTNHRRFGGSFAQAVKKGRVGEPAYWEFYAPDIDQIPDIAD